MPQFLYSLYNTDGAAHIFKVYKLDNIIETWSRKKLPVFHFPEMFEFFFKYVPLTKILDNTSNEFQNLHFQDSGLTLIERVIRSKLTAEVFYSCNAHTCQEYYSYWD